MPIYCHAYSMCSTYLMYISSDNLKKWRKCDILKCNTFFSKYAKDSRVVR